MNMNKAVPWTVAVLVLVLLLAGTPALIGSGVRDATIANAIALIPPAQRARMTITEDEFERGWYSSRGVVHVEYRPAPINMMLPLRFRFQIRHGPLLLTPDGLKAGLAYAEIIPAWDDPDFAAALAELPFEMPPLQVDLLAGLTGSLWLGLEVGAVDYSDENGSLNLTAINGALTAGDDRSVAAELFMESLRMAITSASFDMDLAGLELRAATERVDDPLAPGSISLAIAGFNSSRPRPVAIADASLEAGLQASVTDPELIDWRQRVQIGRIEGELPLASLDWTTELLALEGEVLRRYYEASRTTSSGGLPALTGLNGDAGMILLRNPLILNNLIEANLYGGNHSAALGIRFAGLPDLTDMNSLDIGELVNAVDAEVDLSLDLAAARRSEASEFLDYGLQERYVRIDNDRVVMNGSLRDGILTLNGEDIVLAQFF